MLGFAHVGSSLSPRSFARSGSALSVLGFAHADSSPSLRSFARSGSAPSVLGFAQVGSSLSLRPPVGTHVACDADEAVMLLVKAYRSVSEREIGTGDDLVVCVLRSGAGSGGDGGASVEVMRFPLKKH